MAHADVTSSGLSRRVFLVFGGVAAAVTGAVVAGYTAISADTATAGQGTNVAMTAEEEEEDGVACPFGLVNDPYPGECRHYRDSNGDGICDYSVPGSGSSLSTGSDVGSSQGFSRHRPGTGRP
jgi:hypothetical protein